MQLLYMLEDMRTPVFDAVMSAVTTLGGETVFMALSVIVFWCVSKTCGYYMLSVGFFGTVINQFLKICFRIPRPWVKDPAFTIVESAREAATGYSFPSGHTQNAFAVFGAPGMMAKKLWLKVLCAVLIILVAFSRMYLGVHTPLDVGVSFAIGIILTAVLYPVFRDIENKPERVYALFGVMLAVSAMYLLYVELYKFPADVDAENLAHGIKNGYTVFGAAAGMLASVWLDRRFLRFETKAVVWAQIVKAVVGLGLVMAIRVALKSPLNALFGGHASADAVRYFAMVIFAGFIWPMTFKWFGSRKAIPPKARRVITVTVTVILCIALLAGFLFWRVTRRTNDEPVEYETTNPLVTALGETMLSAHRAGGGISPENTLRAVRFCAESTKFDVDIFEFDLHMTKDGVLVLAHDSTLDRTSNAQQHFGYSGVKVCDHTYAELYELNMGENFAAVSGAQPFRGLRGEDIPDSLRIAKIEEIFEYLDSVGEYGFIIEIKDSDDRGRAAADKLYAVLKEYGKLDCTVVGTFHNEVTAYMDETYPDMLRSAGVNEVIKFYLYSFLDLPTNEDTFRFTALQVPVDDYVINLGTSRFVNYAHKNNIAVQYWTINDTEMMAYLRDIGADAVMTDVPDAAQQILK